jgi:hypothetical protein
MAPAPAAPAALAATAPYESVAALDNQPATLCLKALMISAGMTLGGLHRWQLQITSRNRRSVISLARKTSRERCTIGYNGVSRWCSNLKWGRRGGLWWLDSRQDSEHNVSDEAGFHQSQASRRLWGVTQQARRSRRNGVVDLGSRCEADHHQRPIFVYSDACIGFIISKS